MEKENTKQMFKVINFAASYVAPQYKFDAKDGFVHWGVNNLYPQYLLDLFNHYGSSTHKSIINRKIRLTAGYGLKDVIDINLKNLISKNKLEDVILKCETDFEIFNGFCFEVIWSNDKTTFDIHYMPFNRIRKGIETKEIDYPHFWYSKNWKEYKKDDNRPSLIRRFDPNIREGKQLYYFIEPNPQADDIYSIPTYSTSINWIELDWEISKFHLNQVVQGFSPSFILNFATGVPGIEEMEDNYRDFRKNYEGSSNSGKIILTYSEGSEQAPSLTPIQLNDSDERFIMLQDMVEKNIVMGHEIPPQIVILTPGRLGSTQEREELLAEFQQNYITIRQREIESVFNLVLNTIGITEPIILKQYGDEIMVEENDKIITEQKQAELRGSITGIDGIIKIQTAIRDGITTSESGIKMLETIFGYDKTTSQSLLGITTPNNQQIIQG